MPASPAVAEREVYFDGDGWDRSPTGLLIPPAPGPACLESGLPIAIELFAGAGGMSCGLHQAGFHVIAASDSWATAALTYLTNLGAYPCDIRYVEQSDEEAFEKTLRKAWGMKKNDEYPEHVPSICGSGWLSSHCDHEIGSCAHHIDDEDGRRSFCETYHAPPRHRHGCELFWLGDVRKLTAADFLEPLGLEPGQVDLVAGGPPCQGFSHVGQRNVMDPRNSLVFEFTRLVAEIAPKSMMMENVPGMVSMTTPEGISVVDALALDLEQRGYGVRDALAKSLRLSSGAGVAVKSRSVSKTKDRARAETELDEPKDDAQIELFAECGA